MAFELDVENMHIDKNLCSIQLNKDGKPFITTICTKDKMTELINTISKLNSISLICKSYINIMELLESIPGFSQMLTEKDKENMTNIKIMLNE
jgi:hypothetical protein